MIIPFQETQRFKLWWIVLPIVVLLVVFGFIVFPELIGQKDSGNTPMPRFVMVFTGLSLAATVFLLTSLKLTTHIDHEKIEYRFFPFHFKPRTIYWNDVNKVYTRQYKPVLEYGGWGIRNSYKNGKVINVSGNMGIQLELNNGKKILIGSNKIQDVELLFMQLKKQYPKQFNG